jgi:hypothetical protein
MKDFPTIRPRNMDEVIELLRYITKERTNDVSDFENLNNRFISGRKVAKIPTGAADITDTDRVGDFNADANYVYFCINNSGTAEWRRCALLSW